MRTSAIPRIKDVFHETYNALPSKKDMLYTDASMGPGKTDVRWSQVGTAPDLVEFTGTVDYASVAQGFDTTVTPLEYARGMQIERKLHDDDLQNVIDGLRAVASELGIRGQDRSA